MQFRKCEIKKDGEWVGIKFRDLKYGDIFKLYDPINKDGEYEETPVEWEGNTEFIAEGDAYCVNGLWIVKMDVYTPEIP